MLTSDPRPEAQVGDRHPDLRAAYDKLTAATMLTKPEHAEAFAFEVMRVLDDFDRRLTTVEARTL